MSMSRNEALRMIKKLRGSIPSPRDKDEMHEKYRDAFQNFLADVMSSFGPLPASLKEENIKLWSHAYRHPGNSSIWEASFGHPSFAHKWHRPHGLRDFLESLTTWVMESPEQRSRKENPVEKGAKWTGKEKVSYDRTHRKLTIGKVTRILPANSSPKKELFLKLLVEDYQGSAEGITSGKFRIFVERERGTWTDLAAQTAYDGLVGDVQKIFGITHFIVRSNNTYSIPKIQI